eukprot:CAMPEP_0167787422 /NCGR_PEP_ID=MMETSP0111_2-20121227/9412_1 /TAXON_ID=91324 /ORGANISM="Lotharella globosa, Strain CCCM811" /LENGTH=157 /DNA_ID=CAMNT_0007679059 /DNA_START=184 /DNA_END=653 /DNA_ORIENTATION=-
MLLSPFTKSSQAGVEEEMQRSVRNNSACWPTGLTCRPSLWLSVSCVCEPLAVTSSTHASPSFRYVNTTALAPAEAASAPPATNTVAESDPLCSTALNVRDLLEIIIDTPRHEGVGFIVEQLTPQIVQKALQEHRRLVADKGGHSRTPIIIIIIIIII